MLATLLLALACSSPSDAVDDTAASVVAGEGWLRVPAEAVDGGDLWGPMWAAEVGDVEGPVPTMAYVYTDVGTGETTWIDYTDGVVWWSLSEVRMQRDAEDSEAVFYVWIAE